MIILDKLYELLNNTRFNGIMFEELKVISSPSRKDNSEKFKTVVDYNVCYNYK
jgi:hypothetical protein